MCDHCSKVTGQKGYAGQVTCKCDHGEKKNGETREKDFGGCCSKKERKTVGGCCGSKCCAGTQEEGGCCTGGTASSREPKSCCGQGKAREASGGCCMSGCCKDKSKSKEAEAPSKCCADRK